MQARDSPVASHQAQKPDAEAERNRIVQSTESSRNDVPTAITGSFPTYSGMLASAAMWKTTVGEPLWSVVGLRDLRTSSSSLHSRHLLR